MNSSGAKRYLVNRKPMLIKGDWKIFDISNGKVIFEADESWADLAAKGYNHFYCLPNKPLKYFVMNFSALFDSIMRSNGASYNLHTKRLNPDTGYMVALLGFEKIVDIPTDLNKFQDAVIAYCINKDMWDKINTNPENIYLGFWINDGKLYIDLTENIANKKEAILTGHVRNQIAIYDCYEQWDIKLALC